MAHHCHDHSHGHEHHNKAFAWALGLNLAFVILEAWYAFVANSQSLLADAGHNLGDVSGLFLAWWANWLLTRRPSVDRYSYGYKKTTILASFANAMILILTCGYIGYESILKLYNPEPIQGNIVIAIAFLGIVLNGGTALLFLKGRKSDLNIQGAYIHLMSDALFSLGVVIVGVVIAFTDWYWIDPIASLLIVVAILWGTWGLLRDSIHLLLAAVPRNIDQKAVKHYLLNLPGVASIHDLHIWGLSTREAALTAHVVMPKDSLTDEDFEKINEDFKSLYAIEHVTLQVESGQNNILCGKSDGC